MAMTPVYLLTIPGNPSVKISQDELRSLLGEIETELHHSKVYRHALAMLEKLLGSSQEKAKILFKSVSREAIGLAFQKFALKHQTVADINPQLDTAVSPTVEPEQSSDLSQYLTTIASPSKQGNLLPESNLADNTVSSPEGKAINKTPSRWLHRTQKSRATEQAQQRLETLHQIGQQLRQARESQNLSLRQLYVYTHVSLDYMEAVENGNLHLLPEDVLIRGFIRVMGNALGLNGTILAASLPAPNQVKPVLPFWDQSKKRSGASAMEISPIHLYVGYAAFIAGAVGGLSWISQQTNSKGALNSDVVIPGASFHKELPQSTEATTKPGIKSGISGISVGSDIAPPETL
ncbi:helix-turn-helix domain-containing protein [Cylindrospermum sp. FACHB-282]|uniref:helix-turn-helix domain-containing protein n=1 Tax=Cylindrospermum sp. FACHB-282 TaxID=2692794 RepID=UPI001685F960|nr:helix-turn-helix domain-containing protein [Cylindrospermum sp. FACHB-282]MBD2387221.1 helix-turn-helix domain-containing protein [Cylindrospermum sp. FACHB-282]